MERAEVFFRIQSVHKTIYLLCRQVKVDASFRSPLVVSFGSVLSFRYYCIKIF